MSISPFHAMYKARTLSSLSHGKDKLVPVFASSDIEIYPYQIAAAMFALRSPYQKGVILCDDGSLGKSFETMLIITQMWYEGKERILIIVPTPLLKQWIDTINGHFTVPLISIDNNAIFQEFIENGCQNPFEQNALVITTYDFATEKSEYISQISWNATIFEEAHILRRIYTGDNKGAIAIQQAVKGSFKILLTATPMQSSIMDLYGLINFIDENVFTDEKTFYSRYFRKPENYEELSRRVSKYCFRTLRSQVKTYVKIPERMPITAEFTLSNKEQRLYDLINDYLQKPKKLAFPKMEQYDLTLMLFRHFSSSTFAITKTLRGIVNRLEGMKAENPIDAVIKEYEQALAMYKLAKSIKENSKGKVLLTALDEGFTELTRLGASKKALIFTENRSTQKYLFALLNKGKYKGKVLLFNGDYSRDYSIMERFEKEAQILISTDIAAEGFHLPFCSFVVNYDLPYNALKVEQRINRCHRYGQQCDVIVLNFLNRNNFADVRILELINKRVLQFDGIMGMSDTIIGNFGEDLEKSFAKILSTARSKDEIDKAFNEILAEYEPQNTKLVKTAEQSLFSSFNREISERVTVTPQYIKDKTNEINDDLWDITKYFLAGKQGYTCEDETRTVRIGICPQKIFTGVHLGRREYSMTDKSLPKSGWHTLTGTLAKNIIGQIFWEGIPDKGHVLVENGKLKVENCIIGYYRIRVKSKSDFWGGWFYNVFVGKTQSGRLLSHDECEVIMRLPVLKFTADGTKYGERDGSSKEKSKEPLDVIISADEYINNTLMECNSAQREEIEKYKAYTADQKLVLERMLEKLRNEVKAYDSGKLRNVDIAQKLESQKKHNELNKELKQREQNLFMDKLKIEADLENKLKVLKEQSELIAEVKREFIITVN